MVNWGMGNGKREVENCEIKMRNGKLEMGSKDGKWKMEKW